MTMNGSGSASDGERNQCFNIDIEKLVPASECCIYKVPKKLREINKKAYTPPLVSIGPFHHYNKNLAADIQKQKIRYQHESVERIGQEKFKKLGIFVKDHEKDICMCYADQASRISSHEKFIEMILNDAIFIIELLLRNYNRDDYKSDFLLHQQWLTKALKLDLQLLENQLPYFVLKKLYILACQRPTGEISPSFLSLSCRFFDHDEKSAEKLPDDEKLKHFLDLRRYAMGFYPYPKLSGDSSGKTTKEGATKKGSTTTEDLPSAVSLNESGMIFRNTSKSGSCLLDIKFKKGTRCVPFFCKNELQIPRITIEDFTECLIRNVMALEQCHYPWDAHICNYIGLIDSLIDTCKDVDLLVESGIISNHVGDHASISEMFNKLCLQITTSDSCYANLIVNLIAYHNRWWNRTKATLKSVYFRDVWRGTATTAATAILLLTVLTNHAKIMGRLDSTWKVISRVILILLYLECIFALCSTEVLYLCYRLSCDFVICTMCNISIVRYVQVQLL